MATNGLVVWDGKYDAFGNCTVELEGITNNLRFAGQYFDAETGLHYNLNRYYDPQIGRYLRADPFGDGLNLYAYCFNNPNGLIDPLGLCAVKNFFFFFGQANFWAGFGVTITLGGSKWIRDQWNQTYGWSDSVNYSSGTYKAGQWSGYAWELATGVAGATKMVGKNAIRYGAKAGSAAGSIVGGISFITELAMGKSFGEAGKTGLISGVTTAVNVGLAATGQAYLVSAAAAATTNAVLQHSLNKSVNVFSAVTSAIPSSVGGFFLSQSGAKGISIAVTTGLISSPGTVGVNALSE